MDTTLNFKEEAGQVEAVSVSEGVWLPLLLQLCAVLQRRLLKTILELAFDSKMLRKICESEKAADRYLGQKAARTLRSRLADLLAATNVVELVAGNPLMFDGHPATITVSLRKCYQMSFEVNHVRPPKLPSGITDWSRVTRLKLMKIEDAKAEN